MTADAPNLDSMSGQSSAAAIDPAKAQALFAELVQQQNLLLGIASGLMAAFAGAILWAVVTVATGFQIGWMAVGIGFLVGLTVRFFGKGLTKSFGIAGGVLALFGCLLGNILAVCGLLAKSEGEPIVSTTLSILSNPLVAIELMKVTFSPMDVLFYAIAVYEGYKFSFRQVSEQELEGMLS